MCLGAEHGRACTHVGKDTLAHKGHTQRSALCSTPTFSHTQTPCDTLTHSMVRDSLTHLGTQHNLHQVTHDS